MEFRFFFNKTPGSVALEDHARRKIMNKISKFVTKPIEAHVSFSEDHHQHVLSIGLVGGDGFTMQVEHASDGDWFGAVVAATEKLEMKLRKHKEKLKNHRATKPSRIE